MALVWSWRAFALMPMKDERKTKKQLIEELEAERQKSAGVDVSGVERQLAVERVRAEAMAMRSTDDLLQVSGVLAEEMHALGSRPRAAASGSWMSDDDETQKRGERRLSSTSGRDLSFRSAELLHGCRVSGSRIDVPNLLEAVDVFDE